LQSDCCCGHVFTYDQLIITEKRQVFDLPQPRLEVTEYQIHKAICPECGLQLKGIAPEGITAPAQYGNGVKAYTTLLNVHYKLPFKKIQLLFTDLFGYPINESTVYSATQTCYEKLQASETIIKSKIVESEVVHADETGLRIEGSLHWLHVTTTTLFTYLFVHKKRGELAIRSEQSVLKNYFGWLIHDCWSTYFNLTNAKHGICGAHILRELQALIENDQSKWAKAMKALIMNTYLMPFEERVKRRQPIESRYDLICTVADRLEPPPQKTSGKRGKYKRTKGRNLLERLVREKKAALAFAFNHHVPFTNNLAERDLRPAKIKQKISNCFRSEQGANIYARIESFISTARKHDQNVFDQLFNTFVGDNFITRETGW
jgi:transposase